MRTITAIGMIGFACLAYGDGLDAQDVEPSPAISIPAKAEPVENAAPAESTPVKPQGKKSFGPASKSAKAPSKVGLDTPTAHSSETSSGMRLVLGMALLIAVMAGTFYILKKFSRRMSGEVSGAAMRIVQRVQVDSKNSIVMLRIREEEILVAVGPGGSSLLTRFEAIEDESEANMETTSERAERESSDALPVSQLGLAAFLPKNIQGGAR